jgi:hypothetical protein
MTRDERKKLAAMKAELKARREECMGMRVLRRSQVESGKGDCPIGGKINGKTETECKKN